MSIVRETNHLPYYSLYHTPPYAVRNKRTVFHVKAGDLVFINAYELHKTFDAGMPDHERILIKFKENFIATENNSIKAVLSRLFAQDKYLLRPASNDRSVIESSLFNMLNETRTKQQGYEVMLQSLLMKLLVYANRAIETNWVEHYEHQGHMNRKVSDIIKYINEHFAEPITLTGISERFFISRFHLSRVFKESIGFTFIEYLNDVRIKEAQRLLRETNHKVINIAEAVGFESVAHFGRVFKSVSGSSPLTYRKNYLH